MNLTDNLENRKQATRKIAEPERQRLCNDPQHNPPSMYCFSPGTYEHTCPACGVKKIFTVPQTTL